MKALVYTGPGNVAIRNVPDPVPEDGDVLLRVDAVGICGSDMHAFLGHDERRPPPLILGHEVAGTVLAGMHEGKRVTVNPLVTCDVCEYCISGRNNLCRKRQIISMPPREGGFAEMLTIPAKNIIVIPNHVSAAKASLTEPLACGWHAVRLAENALSKPLKECRCVVLGGGAIGLGAALVLAAKDAGKIIISETNAHRRQILAQAGDFVILDPSASLTADLENADLIVDAVGFAATRKMACEAITPGGVIVHIGLGQSSDGLDIRRMTLQEITFIGTYTYSSDDFKETAQAIFKGRLGALDWIDERPLDNGAGAFQDIRSGQAASPKIVLKPASV